MMRDLLYLSENKMRALVPQLPGQLRRRLGFEAGLNAGVVSAKATLQTESQPSSVALLDAVVEMIEREKGSRWRTDSDLRAGDWIQFEEEFRYGDADNTGLAYFAAADTEAPFVLIGSTVHVLDRGQSGANSSDRYEHFWFYIPAFFAYAGQLARMPDEAATAEFIPPLPGGTLHHALLILGREAQRKDSNWAIGPARLSGHARTLAVMPTGKGPPAVLATPLYVEYAHHE
jgi:hypothetical protein